MVRTERRQAPRMAVNGPAYVNLDPNNGGVILNISEGGLCFQSTAPIQRTDTIRFWFSYRNQLTETDTGQGSQEEIQTKGVSRFIEVRSELAWIDQTRKLGGVRFTNLPANSREQIRNWIRQASLVAVKEKAALSPRKLRFAGATRLLTNAGWRAYAGLEGLIRQIRSAKIWSGFSGGLLAGVLVSVMIVAIFSLHSHSRELGDKLIRLGERIGGRAWTQPVVPLPQASPQEPQTTSPSSVATESRTLSSDARARASGLQEILREPRSVSAAPLHTQQQEKLVAAATPAASKSYGAKLEAASSATSALPAASVKPSDPAVLSSTAGRPLSPAIATGPASEPKTGLPPTIAPEPELANRPPGVYVEPSKVEGIEMRSEKYLEVGKFKEKLMADKTTGKLSNLGFTATVVPWNRFFGKSYHVLVGPYEGNREAEAAHKELVTLGFTPRSYERGKRNFRMPPALKVAGTPLPTGDCVIRWESYTPDATVKIEDDRGTGVTVEGKWVKQEVKYPENAVAYQKNSDGSRTLLEIRFAGMEQALVFGSN